MKKSQSFPQGVLRYDLSTNKSLRAWSAADEMLHEWAKEQEPMEKWALYHDRFGYLTLALHQLTPVTYTLQHSQMKAIQNNLHAFDCSGNMMDFLSKTHNTASRALIHMPKSLDLFESYLWHIHRSSTADIVVACGFMTRHFSKGMLEIAHKYFEDVQQSRAHKKARLLVMRGKKNDVTFDTTISLTYNNTEYRQYKGMFSAHHIDYATQYFLPLIHMSKPPTQVLDLACGNGVIGKELSQKWPNANFHLLDDSSLAVAAAKFNFPNATCYYAHDLNNLPDQHFDLIVSNPPFHFEYDINIQIPLRLFQQAFHKLKNGGYFQCVANNHLNYGTHLAHIFSSVKEAGRSDRFTVYHCQK